MDKWKSLNQEEQSLRRTEEGLEEEARNIQRLQESYDDHFREASQFVTELQQSFQQHEDQYFYVSVSDEFSNEAQNIMGNLVENEQELHIQRRKLQQMIEDITYEKRRVTIEQEESTK